MLLSKKLTFVNKQLLPTTINIYGWDIFLFVLFVSVIALRVYLKHLNNDVIQNVFLKNVITYAVLAGTLSYFCQPRTNNELERTILAINNELQRMCTENNWKNNAISQGESQSAEGVCMWFIDCDLLYVISDVYSMPPLTAGSNQFSSVSHIFTGLHFVYDDDTEMYWSKYVAIFDQKRKKVKKSSMQMYYILSREIGLSPAILASFYHIKEDQCRLRWIKSFHGLKEKEKG